MKTLEQAIAERHSVRKYKTMPLPGEIAETLRQKIEQVNTEANLHIQLITDEPKGFNCLINYGTFSGITNYLVVAGEKRADLDEKAGYYGEQIVLLAQQLGLNTCWAGMSYQKVKGTYTLTESEKIVCYIALGYGETQGTGHKIKTIQEVSNVTEETPEWFKKGVEAALLAPTAVNQQKFRFTYLGPGREGRDKVRAEKTFSMIGYTQLDLGIAKLHFEIAAGRENFEWER